MHSIASIFALLLLISCSTSGPITATGNKIGSSKGVSCKRNILFLIPISFDDSIYTAARKGRIAEISTVDSKSFTSFIYNSHCTVVHGTKDKSVTFAEEDEEHEDVYEELKKVVSKVKKKKPSKEPKKEITKVKSNPNQPFQQNTMKF